MPHNRGKAGPRPRTIFSFWIFVLYLRVSGYVCFHIFVLLVLEDLPAVVEECHGADGTYTPYSGQIALSLLVLWEP